MIRSFRWCWKSLAWADIVFKIITFVLLAPLVGLLFRLFVALSGRTVLADVDLACFFLHPIGWSCFVVVAVAALGILALEQSALMSIASAAHEGRPFNPRQALHFSFQKARSVLCLTGRMVGRLQLIAAPFLAVGGGLYVALLTEHDINYYLVKKPPVFWVAASAIGCVLAAMIAVLARSIIVWSLALPLVLFEDVPARDALRRSSERTMGGRKKLGLWFVAWFVASFLVSSLGAGLVAWLGRLVIPLASGSLWMLCLTVGAVLLSWAVVHFVITLLSTTTFAVLLVNLYLSNGRSEAFALSELEYGRSSLVFGLSRPRVVTLSACTLLASALIGFVAIHSIDLEDHTQVTAHRGASGKAPENTLAAVRQAIDDKADWVEIDVQECKDGVVIVAHDRDLKKVSGADLEIRDVTADELRLIDIGSYFDPKFKDERVPTLAEVLQTCKGKVKVNIELKYYGHDENLEQRVIDLVESHGMESDVVFMSLKADGIHKVKKLRPTWTVGLLSAVAAGDLTRAEADFLAVSVRLATASFIRSAHRRGKGVYVWTVNDKATMSIMMGRGVDGIITDHPALARAVLAERAELSPVERLLVELAFFLGVAPNGPPDTERP